jgi:hypothetical protein
MLAAAYQFWARSCASALSPESKTMQARAIHFHAPGDADDHDLEAGRTSGSSLLTV